MANLGRSEHTGPQGKMSDRSFGMRSGRDLPGDVGAGPAGSLSSTAKENARLARQYIDKNSADIRELQDNERPPDDILAKPFRPSDEPLVNVVTPQIFYAVGTPGALDIAATTPKNMIIMDVPLIVDTTTYTHITPWKIVTVVPGRYLIHANADIMLENTGAMVNALVKTETRLSIWGCATGGTLADDIYTYSNESFLNASTHTIDDHAGPLTHTGSLDHWGGASAFLLYHNLSTFKVLDVSEAWDIAFYIVNVQLDGEAPEAVKFKCVIQKV